jgi:hypothetical protein
VDQFLSVAVDHFPTVATSKYAPSIDFVVKAARAFGISVDVLLSEPEGGVQEVSIQDKDMAERLRLLETLEKDERDALIKVMDAMLTKQRVRRILEQSPVHAAD